MKADLVLKSNSIFTSLQKETISGCIAIKDNRIAALGTEEELSSMIGENTVVKQYHDKLIMPGFVDAHVHYFVGAVSASAHMCTEIGSGKSEKECVDIIKAFAKTHPDEKRIIGIGWFPANWDDPTLPNKISLDEAIPDKPVYLIAADVHTFWMNSAALEESGITPQRKPKSGEIGLFENGELSGLLFEPEAFAPAMGKVMDMEKEDLKKLHIDFLKKIAASGVTSISDMSADDYTESTYRNYAIIRELEEEGALTSRIHLYTRLEGYTNFEKAKEFKSLYHSEKLELSGVKGFIDGVTSTHTAYLLEPYDDNPKTTGIGAPLVDREHMEKSVIAANGAGFPVRLHCIGDGAVRMALDLFETSLKKNGEHGLFNTIEHIESIDASDIGRFKELNVIPSMQPYHLTLDGNEKLVRIGEKRCELEWSHRSLLDQGAQLAFGTDYPVVDFNPFPSIYAAVTRCDDEGTPTGVNPHEKIDLAETLIAYTAGAARAYGRLSDIGTLEKGKLADIAVIDRNLFDVQAKDILHAKTLLTIMDGRIVYDVEKPEV